MALNLKVKAFTLEITLISSIIILGLIAKYGTNALIGRMLGPEGFGDYRVTINFLLIVGQMLVFGLDIALIKHIPPLMRLRQYESVKSFLLATFQAIAMGLLFCFIIGSLIAIFAYVSIKYHNLLAPYIHATWFYLELAGVISVGVVVTKAVRAIGYNVLSSSLLSLKDISLFAFIVFLHAISLNYAILSTVVSYALISVIAFIFIGYKFYLVNSQKMRFSKPLIRDLRLFWLQQLTSNWWVAILLFIIEILPRQEAEVGTLASLLSLTDLAYIPIFILKSVFQVFISQSMSQPNRVIIRRLNIIGLISISFTCAMLFIFYNISPFILSFYGSKYTVNPQQNLLLMLAIASNLPTALMVGDGSYLTYSKEGNVYLTNLMLWAVGLLIAIGFWLTSLYGPLGALWAYTITQMFASFGTLIISRYLLSR